MKTRNIILKISFIAILSALIFVSTTFLSFPYAGGIGYFNFSDGLILFSTIYLGPSVGIISGIIGCSLSDLYIGFANCIPFTIVAKSLEAIAIYFIFNFLKKTKFLKYLSYFIAPLFMVLAYMPYYLIYDDGKGAIALLSSAFDLIQGFIGGIVALTLNQLFYQIHLPVSYFKKEYDFKNKKISD